MNTRQSAQHTRAPLMRVIIAALIALVVAGTVAPMLTNAYARLANAVSAPMVR
jgi:hypothetical protein